MPLLGPNGQPIEFKKAAPPKLGPAYGQWAGRDALLNQLPGGAMMSYDLNRLTLADFRAMRMHPQINASLSVLTFMMHQLDWWIECDDKKIAETLAEMLHEIWTRLIRGLSQAYWAGFSPMAIEYDNDVAGQRVVITKIKDLLPEECVVNWKIVEGYAPPGRAKPKFKEYDGIKQFGGFDPIPPENSLWYPLLMENGNYYGRKLLKPAFGAWYFSQLIHLFANRYFERFGEPLPIGRAPFDDVITTSDPVTGNETTVTGKDAMELILRNLRNRSVVVLPNDRVPVGTGTSSDWEYTVEYLESQMRGADFERYLSRLDEEMSLGIFTPTLLFRTADVGSYNLGVAHMQVFLWMLNALAGDFKEYVDRFVISRLKDYNFGPRAPKAEFEYRKMGKENGPIIQAIMNELVRNNQVRPDLQELGQIIGLSLTEIKNVAPDPLGEPVPDTGPKVPPSGPGTTPPAKTTKDTRVRARPAAKKGPRSVGQPRATTRQISNRIQAQVDKAWRDGTFGTSFTPNLGYRRRFEESLVAEGFERSEAMELTELFYNKVQGWMEETIKLGMAEFAGPHDFMALFDRLMETEVEELAA